MTDFYQKTPEQQLEIYRQLAADALQQWELQGAALTPIKVRENAVFKVEAGAGKKYIIRIHRAGYHSNEELHSELQWMQALRQEGIQVPQLVPAREGAGFILLGMEHLGELRQIDLFEWVNGRQLGSVETGLAGDVEAQLNSFRIIGELSARVHNQSMRWQAPAGFVRHAWDISGLVGEHPFWGRFWELAALSREERVLMLRVRQRLTQDLLGYAQSSDSYSMIHADMVPENVLVDGGEVRLIDFDDAGFGWHLFEMATSLYFSRSESYFEQLVACYIEGYRRQRSLPDSELQYLPLFMLARATTYLGWVHTRQETETARELTPMLIEQACRVAEEYLTG